MSIYKDQIYCNLQISASYNNTYKLKSDVKEVFTGINYFTLLQGKSVLIDLCDSYERHKSIVVIMLAGQPGAWETKIPARAEVRSKILFQLHPLAIMISTWMNA